MPARAPDVSPCRGRVTRTGPCPAPGHVHPHRLIAASTQYRVGMAKPTRKEALAAWREAENKYRKTLEPFFEEGTGAKLDKGVAVMVTKARVKADKKMELYFHTCLD